MEKAPQQIIDWIRKYSNSGNSTSNEKKFIEVANYAALPATGQSNRIYITLNDNAPYRWSESTSNYIPLSATAWSKTGNAGTNPSTDFIGTTDNQDLVFKRNNTEVIRLNSVGFQYTQGGTNTILDHYNYGGWSTRINPANGNFHIGLGNGLANVLSIWHQGIERLKITPTNGSTPSRIESEYASNAISFPINNVLIGTTTNAGYKLDVNGTFRVNNKVNLSGLPTSSVGLSSGDLWNDGGVINII